ncbi:hypothetical protein PFISCL1PPCAC_4218, partial [Pristionchus fissidentatus]
NLFKMYGLGSRNVNQATQMAYSQYASQDSYSISPHQPIPKELKREVAFPPEPAGTRKANIS